MICPHCSKQNVENNSFCIYCGTRLLEGPFIDSEPEEVAIVAGEDVSTYDTTMDQPLADPTDDSADVPETAALRLRLMLNRVENILGTNWLVIIGVIAIFIGISFLMKLAIDENMISPEMLVLAGVISGVLFLAAGELLWSRYPIYAHALSGGGIALLYSSLMAAFIRGEVDVWLASGLLLMVGAVSVGLAFKKDSQPLALLGVAGGLLAPFLYVGLTDSDAQLDKLFDAQRYFLIIYVLVIGLGVMGVAIFKNWRWFKLVSVFGSYLGYGLWFGEFESRYLSVEAPIFVLSLMFLILFVSASGFHLIRRLSPGGLDFSPMVWNALLYVIISYIWVLDQDAGSFEDWRALPTLAIGILHLGIAYVALQTNHNKPVLAIMLAGIGIVCVSIAIPMQFHGYVLIIGMSTNAAFILWLSTYVKSNELKVLALASFIFTILRLISIETKDSSAVDRFVASLWLTLALYVSLFAYNKYRDGFSIRFIKIPTWIISQEDLDRNHRWLYRVTTHDLTEIFLLISANALSIWTLSIEVSRFIDSQALTIDQANQWKSLSITVLWSAYSILLVITGIGLRSSFIRLSGLGLLSMTVFKLFIYDTFNLDQLYRVTAYIVLGVLLLLGGLLYQRYQPRIRGFFIDSAKGS